MNDISLAFRQVLYENKAFWRNPPAAFFTFVMPLMFLVIFNLVFGNNEMKIPGGITHSSTFYVPAILALSVISACYTNIAIGLCISRDKGILKRIKGTPLPTWAFLFGRIIHTVFIALILVIIVLSIGIIFYNVSVPFNTILAFIITLTIGAATFASLGIAITTLVANADAAPAVVNASILPLMFVSDIFFPMHDAPTWINNITYLFPVKPFSSALQSTFNPFEAGNGLETMDLTILCIWMIFGIVISLRFFTWEPKN